MKLKNKWKNVIKSCTSNVNYIQNLELWFDNVYPISYKNGLLVISIPSKIHYNFFEERISKEFFEAVKFNFGADIKIRYKIYTPDFNKIYAIESHSKTT